MDDRIVKDLGKDNPGFELGNDTTSQNGQKADSNTEKENTRAQWGNGMEFLMSCVAMSVGLGNVWRFPFTAYENGGGAFLIPYLVILTLIGRPLYYMEMALGQFSNKGNIRFFESLSPFMKGVGWGQVIAVIFVASYYCSLMAITLLYLVHSFNTDLPWAKCLDGWTPYLAKINKTCVPALAKGGNDTYGNNTISSSELFFTQEVLQETQDISNGIGKPEWKLTLCLLISWLITFFISVKGVKSSGKVSYFLAVFPYVILIAILIRAATLEGAAEGMYYFIKTDWNKLLEADVWYAAVTQCFFSLNVGFGSIIMFSSYNDFNHNIHKDALIVTALDTVTSLLAGITIFGILGNLAYNLGVTPDKVISSGGIGLAFISYPDAIAKMEAVPWVFSILFFFMLFILGLGSLMAHHGTMNTVLQDIFPNLSTWKVAGCTASLGFLIGLMYVTPGGQFMLNLIDYFAGTFIIFTFAIVEVIGVAWCYGLENFCLDLEFMLKRNVNIYWRITWGIVTPVSLIAIFIYFCAKFKSPTYGSSEYPNQILAIGWVILFVAVAQFLFWIAYYMVKYKDEGYPKMISKTFSNDNWGPTNSIRYEDWKKFKSNSLTKSANRNRSYFRKCLDNLFGR